FALRDFCNQPLNAPLVDELADDHDLVAVDVIEVHDVERIRDATVSAGHLLRFAKHRPQTVPLAVLLVVDALTVPVVPPALRLALSCPVPICQPGPPHVTSNVRRR